MSEHRGVFKCLNATCRDAARLVTERDERLLAWPERVGLFIHLAICRSCRRYRRGVIMLRQVMRKAAASGGLVANQHLPGPARERIGKKLTESNE